jgi:glyoxylate carboligase
MNLKNVKQIISREKIKFTRGYTYVSTLGIPFLVAKQLEIMFPNWNWIWYFNNR